MTARRHGSGNRRPRPYKVFVQEIGPTWSFATRAAAERRAVEAITWMGYAEVLTYGGTGQPAKVWRHGHEEPVTLEQRVAEVYAEPTPTIIRRTNPDPVRSNHGGEPQWRCTVCRSVYDDAERARACAVADFAKRDEELDPCA